MGVICSTLSTPVWQEYGSTAVYSTGGLAAAMGQQQQSQLDQRSRLYNQMLQQLNQPLLSRGAANQFVKAAEPQKGKSMVDEFRGYVREYKDWIFTIAIVAIVDHFFLDGALKDKLASALGKKLDSGDAKA